MGEKNIVRSFGHIKKLMSEELVEKCFGVKSWNPGRGKGRLGDGRIG